MVSPFFNLNPYAAKYSKSYLYQLFSKMVTVCGGGGSLGLFAGGAGGCDR